MVLIYIFIIIVAIIIITKSKFSTIRYHLMMRITNLKALLKKNDVIIIKQLNLLNTYINRIILFLDTNPILHALIENNKIPITFIITAKNVLEYLNKIILYMIDKIKKK